MGFTRVFRHPSMDWLQKSLLGILALCALVSVVVGVLNGVQRSGDIQWSPERLVLQHIDPWAEYVKGDPDHRFVDTQFPNYLPSLYVLLVPLGMMPQVSAKLVWALCNVLFAVGSGLILGRVFGLSPQMRAVLLSLVLMATETRNTIGNGQQGLLILLLWCLSLQLASGTISSHLLLGLSYFKYSFAPPLALFTAVRAGIRGVLWSMVPWLAGLTGMWFWLSPGSRPASFLRFALEPFAAARNGFRPEAGDPNLMAVLEDHFASVPHDVMLPLAGLVALVCCTIVGVAAFNRVQGATDGWKMAVMATMSYVLFQHHPYDAVVLILPFAYALAHWKERKAQWFLALTGYLFYLERLIQALHLDRWWFQYMDCAVLLCLLAVLYSMEGSIWLPARVRRVGPADCRHTVSEEAARQLAA